VELALDGTISAVTGVLPATMAANMRGTQIMARPVGSIAKTPPSRATSRART
jgi:predicted ATPase with chaperone activity